MSNVSDHKEYVIRNFVNTRDKERGRGEKKGREREREKIIFDTEKIISHINVYIYKDKILCKKKKLTQNHFS